MTESLTPDVEQVEFASELSNWIARGTLTHRSVPIYFNGGVLAEIDELVREHDLLTRTLVAEPGLGDDTTSRLAEIQARLEELAAEKEQSKSTWVVRKLIGPDFDAIREYLPEPESPDFPSEPDPLADDASDDERAAHEAEVARVREQLEAMRPEIDAYEKDAAVWVREYNLHGIAAAVVRVRFGNGITQNGVTADELRALRARFGDEPINRLSRAVKDAAEGVEPVVPIPFSRENSQRDLT